MWYKNKNYYNILNELKADQQNFHELSRDPTTEIKTDVNTIMGSTNKETYLNLKKIYGHYEPIDLYRNPKNNKHEPNPPFRPVISEVGIVTYDTAK